MGAEIGISTQKLHARGPMALRELTSYKYLIAGDGDAAVAPPVADRQKNDPKFCFPEIKSYICDRRVIEK